MENYDYLGCGTVVRRAYPLQGHDLTYIKQGAEPNGDASKAVCEDVLQYCYYNIIDKKNDQVNVCNTSGILIGPGGKIVITKPHQQVDDK